MALGTRLDLRQTTSLVMTPQLQQAIKLLQLSNVELSAYIDQELERNPLLERQDGEAPVDGADDGPGASLSADTDGAMLGVDPGQSVAAPGEAALDVGGEDMWGDMGAGDSAGLTGPSLGNWDGKGGRSDFSDDLMGLEQTLADEKSLREHLTDQLHLEIQDPAQRLIGAQLIDLLDDTGYLSAGLAEVAERIGTGEAEVEAVLRRMQEFEPSGVFARNLRECLAIQLRERDRLDPAMQKLLDNLELLGRRDVDGLRKACGVDGEDLADMIRELRALNPKPGLAFDEGVTQPVTPDVLMRADGSGGWLVELNSDTLPRVLVNQTYYARVNRAARSKEDRGFIAENLQSANWLVKSLHQRATTILKVASEIVRQQDAFFVYGVQYMKPLVLRGIADAIGMHESTVSRVTTNKYMATPRGLFELKYFFTASIPSAEGGAAHSAEAVRHRIRVLIDAEPAERVLSDDRIVEILREDGIDIARRTVAKYREAMRIPSSVQRRREKMMAGAA